MVRAWCGPGPGRVHSPCTPWAAAWRTLPHWHCAAAGTSRLLCLCAPPSSTGRLQLALHTRCTCAAQAHAFYSANPPKGKLMLGKYVPFQPGYKPVAWRSALAKKWTAAKARAGHAVAWQGLPACQRAGPWPS